MKMKPISELSICGRKVSLIANKAGVKEGQKKMEDAVRIFEMLGCNKSAEYYRNTTDC